MSDGNRLDGAARAWRAAPGFARDALVFLGFCALTALMTWPWVLHLRDAVADPGDPYMIAWTLWWDYHQTFTDPLHLFDANVFYPYRYTLAFSEHDYGIALVFFPLFALGVKTLTVHSLATFLGFAFSGYGAFRLTRTLTNSAGAAWVAGVVFAFIPYRFQLLSHLHYLWAGWMPLLLEALVLFARGRSWRRAAWLGLAFLMNALSCVSWFIMTLVPLGLTGLLLVAGRAELRRDREFWVRGAVALGAAGLALLPFLLPYLWVTSMYGLRWEHGEFEAHSPKLIHWLAAERRNKVWEQLGIGMCCGHKLFPGLLAPLLAVAAFRFRRLARGDVWPRERRIIFATLEVASLVAAFIAVLAVGYEDMIVRVLGVRLMRVGPRTGDHALAFIVVALSVRIGLALPSYLKRRRGGEGTGGAAYGLALGVGSVWLAWGFVSSLGANVFLNRWLHEYFFLFQSLRLASRWAMICYIGLAVLAGAGAERLARLAARRFSEPRAAALVFAVASAALLYELHAAPLDFDRGRVEPDAVTLRLKETPMAGGVVELPSAEGLQRHRYMLRAADHGRPLVNATSSFVSPATDAVNQQTYPGPIPPRFMDLLERIPASYLVIHNADLAPQRRPDYENFLSYSLASGRLRFVARFDGGADLYAVTKTEPDARQEQPLPFEPTVSDWAAQMRKDPVNMLGQYVAWTQKLYRLHLAASGRLPRYADFVPDVEALAEGVIPGMDNEQLKLEDNLRAVADRLTRRPAFASTFGALTDAAYVERLLSNAGLSDDAGARERLSAELVSGSATRADLLLALADEPRFAEREHNRSLVLLHFFGYLLRNPDDPPDKDLSGLLHWVGDLDRGGDPAKLSNAFKDSVEYRIRTERK
ncbi:MAG TPA: hypothetical protein VGX48_17080 [Pyrinomonadaceae bacterium]|nr:hypothetical protein [Pyrinomonadaceae bacterium]